MKIQAIKHELDRHENEINRVIKDLRGLVDDEFELCCSNEHTSATIDNVCNRLSWLTGEAS